MLTEEPEEAARSQARDAGRELRTACVSTCRRGRDLVAVIQMQFIQNDARRRDVSHELQRERRPFTPSVGFEVGRRHRVEASR
jgi:hypothetical protein